ncbi:MAG TPA: amidohydrolase family protein [Candidatus Binataceae bacterium]|nr:amidohydrolase family protein [Candidatus Binataceae bacterium]
MAYDLLIRDARICDGTGGPLFNGAVAIADGRIVEVGAVAGPARRTVAADGLVLAPGFIDLHTHYDAQVSWDPLLTCSSWHGVTTVLMGNCGVGVAPVRPQERSTMAWDLVNVEALPHEVLMDGVNWEWESFAEYMAAIARRGVALNAAFLVPLSALRFYVMGEAAAARAATTEETARMAALFRDAMIAGAWGFSLSLAPQHIGFQGRPLASRMASREELAALCRVMRELGRGIIEILPRGSAPMVTAQDQGFDLLVFLAEQSRRPVTFLAIVDLPGTPIEAHERLIERLKPLLARGLKIYPQVTPRPIQQYYTLRDPFIFAALDSWKGVFNRPAEEQKALFRSAEFRAAFKAELQRGHRAVFRGRWDRVHVVRVEGAANRRFLNQSIAEIAATLRKDPEDALLDLALEEDLALGITLSVINSDAANVERIMRLPNTLIGLSDAGAHVAQHCDAGLPTYVLGHTVRERGTLSLEEGVRRLTSEVADFLEMADRGRIRAGAVADLVLFDPDRVGPLAPEWRDDLPGRQPRLIERAEGVEHTIVGGEILFSRGAHQGAMPGRVLRSGEAA